MSCDCVPILPYPTTWHAAELDDQATYSIMRVLLNAATIRLVLP